MQMQRSSHDALVENPAYRRAVLKGCAILAIAVFAAAVGLWHQQRAALFALLAFPASWFGSRLGFMIGQTETNSRDAFADPEDAAMYVRCCQDLAVHGVLHQTVTIADAYATLSTTKVSIDQALAEVEKLLGSVSDAWDHERLETSARCVVRVVFDDAAAQQARVERWAAQAGKSSGDLP